MDHDAIIGHLSTMIYKLKGIEVSKEEIKNMLIKNGLVDEGGSIKLLVENWK